MQDLAGLGVAVVVNFFGLPRAENLQCSACKLRIDKVVLQRDNQAVASERGDEPWKPGGGQKTGVLRACDREPGAAQFPEALAKQTIKFLVAGRDLGHVL